MNTAQDKQVKLFHKILGSLIGFSIGDALGNTLSQLRDSTPNRDNLAQTKEILSQTTSITDLMISVGESYVQSYESYMSGSDNPVDFEERCCRRFEFVYSLYQLCENEPEYITKCVTASSYGKPKEFWMEQASQVDKDRNSPPTNGALVRCLFPALLGNEASAISQGLLTHNNSESSKYIHLYTNMLQDYLGRTSVSVRTKSSFIKPEFYDQAQATLLSAYNWSLEKDFKTAILNASKRSSAIGALTGGLAGARFGISRIPVEWSNQLSEETYTRLRRLAEKATKILMDSEEETL